MEQKENENRRREERWRTRIDDRKEGIWNGGRGGKEGYGPRSEERGKRDGERRGDKRNWIAG